MEIGLSKPLEQGLSIELEEDKIIVEILYEKLSVFCFKCCHVEHRKPSYVLILSNLMDVERQTMKIWSMLIAMF